MRQRIFSPQESRSESKNDMKILSLRWRTWLVKQTSLLARKSPLLDELFSVEQLARHAQALAASHQVVTGQGPNRLLARLGQNEDILRALTRAHLLRELPRISSAKATCSIGGIRPPDAACGRMYPMTFCGCLPGKTISSWPHGEWETHAR